MTWTGVALGDLLEHSIGGVWGKEPGADEVDVRVWRVTELKPGGRLDSSTAARRSVSSRQLVARSLKPGDILLEKSGGGPTSPVGRVGFVRRVSEPAICSNFMQLMRPDPTLVNPRYLHLFLVHFHQRGGTLPMQTASTNIRNIKASEYLKVLVPVPDLDEQRRIVEILEDHLSRLDAGGALLERSRQRTSAFSAAFVSEALRAEAGVSVTLGALADSVRNGIFVSRATARVDGVPILRIGAVRRMALNLSDIGYSRKSLPEVASLDGDLKSGDLLFTRYNGNPEYVGACAVVPEGSGPLTYPDKLIRVRVDRARALPEFVALACSFGDARAELRSRVKTSAGQAGISGRELRAATLQLPSLDAQKRVVERAWTALDAEMRLGEAASAASRRAEALRHSLLAAAFSGQLTGSPSDTEGTKATESATMAESDRSVVGQPELQGALW